MAGFRGAREGIMLVLLVLTVVDAKTPSATTWTRGGSLTASAAFVAPPRRHLQYVYFRERNRSIICGTLGSLSQALCPTRRHVSLLAIPKPSDEEMEQRKEQLRTLLCASDKGIDTLVSRNPTILKRRDIVDSHGPKMVLLQERLDISQKVAGKLCLHANRLLSVSLATLERRIDWLQARLNINKADLRKIIKRDSLVLVLSIEENIEPSLQNIQSVLELSDKELTKMVVRAPEVLCKNFSAEKLASRFSFLLDLLNIEESDIASLRKAVVYCPDILYWPEESMLESQQWMKDRLGLGDSKIAQMCRNTPYLMISKVATLEDKVDWVQTALSLNDDELCKLFGKFPSLLTLSPDRNIVPKLRFLRFTFELDDEELKNLVTKRPSLFTMSEKDIEEKLQFYSELVGETEAKRLVIKSPNLLTVSLKKCLRPRLAEVESAGKKIIWTETLIQRLARRTPELWERYGLNEAPKGRGARKKK